MFRRLLLCAALAVVATPAVQAGEIRLPGAGEGARHERNDSAEAGSLDSIAQEAAIAGDDQGAGGSGGGLDGEERTEDEMIQSETDDGCSGIFSGSECTDQ